MLWIFQEYEKIWKYQQLLSIMKFLQIIPYTEAYFMTCKKKYLFLVSHHGEFW